MDFILDNQETESEYRQILSLIQLHQNGEVADAMKKYGYANKTNWGVSIIELREISKQFKTNHLLALKLWNKQWRETMILATLLDNPDEVSEQQMDFWTKSFENNEIAEQASANLWWKCKYAFVKALEWCRGKKHLVRFSGIHLAGRLAISDKNAIDEMFEPFFEEITTLARDKKLADVIYRAAIAIGSRSEKTNLMSINFSKTLLHSDSEIAAKLGRELLEELTSIAENFKVLPK